MLTKVPYACLEGVHGGVPEVVDRPTLAACAAQEEQGANGVIGRVFPANRRARIRDCYNQKNRFRINSEDVQELLKK